MKRLLVFSVNNSHLEEQLISGLFDGSATISVKKVQEDDFNALGWSVVQVDVQDMDLEVDHHFDNSEVARKYRLRCKLDITTNSPKVSLLKSSGGTIDYKALDTISLFLMLQLGAVDELRSKWFAALLKLPLYEDLAPWNIGLQHGQLIYLDSDTQDKTYEEAVAVVNQALVVLKNFERTVKELGFCGRTARFGNQFPHIACCVDSPFAGPCPDIARPVPCRDLKCYPTYIDCFAATFGK